MFNVTAREATLSAKRLVVTVALSEHRARDARKAQREVVKAARRVREAYGYRVWNQTGRERPAILYGETAPGAFLAIPSPS